MREEDEFAFIGCDNCAEVFRSLDYDDEQQMFKDTTTPHYHGSIAMIHPSHSWVASWQGINNLRPGMYAVEVEDELPSEIRRVFDEKNIRYRQHASHVLDDMDVGGEIGSGDDEEEDGEFIPDE